MLRPSYRLRRLVTIVAAALAFGVAIHGACQAIEHHDGVKDAVALCAAAVALVATVSLLRGRRGSTTRRVPPAWAAPLELIPVVLVAAGPRNSAAWLQRFQN